MKRFLLYGSLAAFLAGCGGQKAEDYSYNPPVFPETESVIVTPITVDEIMPNQPEFLIYDTIAYVAARMDEKCLHAFSLNSGKPLGSYLPIGSGPGEINQSFDIQIDNKNGIITIHQGKKLLHYSIGSDGEVVWTDAIDIPPLSLENVSNMVVQNAVYELPQPGRLLVEDIDPDNPPLMVKKIITDKGAGPAYQNLSGTPGDIRMMNNASTPYAISPDGKRAVYMSRVGGIVQVLDISGDEIKPIKTMRYFPQEFVQQEELLIFQRPFTLGFISVAADSNYFYGAYSGEKVDKVPGSTVNSIGVWDWDGNPVKKYTTDKPISFIYASPDGDALYVMTYDDEEGSQLGKISF